MASCGTSETGVRAMYNCSPEAPAEVQRVRQALPTPGHAMETETPINTGEQRFRKHSPGQRVGGPDI